MEIAKNQKRRPVDSLGVFKQRYTKRKVELQALKNKKHKQTNVQEGKRTRQMERHATSEIVFNVSLSSRRVKERED